MRDGTKRGGRARTPVRLPADESGQGLGYVLVIGTVLLIFLVAIVDVLWKEMRWVVGTQRRNILLVAADGAVDRAMYALQRQNGWDGVPQGALPGYLEDVVYTDMPGVAYTLRVQEGNWTPGYEIGDHKLERTITVMMSNTRTGEQKKVQAVVIQTTLNSAIFSGGQIAIGGSADINWGPVVSYSTGLDTFPGLPNPPPDHPVFLSKGQILLKGVDASTIGMDCVSPLAGKCVDEYSTAVGQQPLVDIAQYRAMAQSSGSYLITGSCSTLNTNTTPGPTTEGSVVFYDTCDNKNYNPLTDGICKGACDPTNHGCDIKTTGNYCGNGALIVLGDLESTGNGCTMALTMTPPPDCKQRLDLDQLHCNPIVNPSLFWNGFIYVANALKSSGTKQIYGTIYAWDSAGVTGNFSVYYKTSNSSLGVLGKSVLVKIWLERKRNPGDVFP